MQFATYFIIVLGCTGIPVFRNKLALIVAPALITTVLFFFAICQHLAIGIVAIKSVGLTMTTYTLYSAFRSKEVRSALFEVGFALILVFSLSYFAAKGMNYFAWDEFSHWGAQVEYLLKFGELHRDGDILIFPEYIPGLSLWRYFARTILIGFGPAAEYFSGWVIVFSCIYVAVDKLPKWRSIAAGLAFYLLFVTLFQALALTLYVDPVQAALLVCGLIIAKRYQNSALNLIPIVALLILSKHVGVIFCLFIFIYWSARQCFVYEKRFSESVRTLTISILFVVICYLAWNSYVSFHYISKDIIDVGKIYNLSAGEAPNFLYDIFSGLLHNKFPHAFWTRGSFSGSPPLIDLWVVLIASLVSSFILILCAENSWNDRKVDLYFVSAFVLFYVLFLTFIRATTPWAADQFSFTRYLSVVLFAVVGLSFPALFENGSQWKLIVIISVLAVVSFFYAPTPKDVFGRKLAPLSDSNELFTQKARTLLSQVTTHERVWYIHDEKNPRDYFVFRMKAIPARIVNPEIGQNVYLNTMGAGWPEKADRIALFASRMCSVDILFIDAVADYFWEDYAELFDKPKAGHIFRVRKGIADRCTASLVAD